MVSNLSALVSLALLASPGIDGYEGHQGVVVQVEDLEQARTVATIAAHVLDENQHLGPVRAIVDGQGLAALGVAGIDYTVIERDVQGRVAEERARIDSSQTPRDFDGWFEEYKTLDQIYAHVDALAELAPDLVAVTQIGMSAQGRPIKVVRVGSGEGPVVVITGVQHAREWIASMVPMCVLDHVLRNPEDPAVIAALGHVTLYVVPIANPDGFVYTWDGDRYWRKNRNGTGVDLNRNWGEGWGGEIGSSGDLDSDVYRGETPFSEPETAALRDFLDAHDVAALIDFHSFAGVVASSWAYTDEEPADIGLLRAWGDGLAEQINSHHDYGYRSLHGMEANETIGYASGTQPDWVHAKLEVPAFTIELRPRFDEEGSGGFELAPEMIVPTCEESVPAVLDLARWAAGSVDPEVSITDPIDGAVFEQIPTFAEILVDVDYAGPLAKVNLEINGQVQGWNDAVYPHDAEIEFPKGTWELIAHVETWDGKTAVSEPVMVTVGEAPGTGDDSGGPGTGDGGTGEDDGGGTGTSDGNDEAGAGQLGANDSGCGCGAGPRESAGAAFAVLLLAGIGRRKRSPAEFSASAPR